METVIITRRLVILALAAACFSLLLVNLLEGRRAHGTGLHGLPMAPCAQSSTSPCRPAPVIKDQTP